MTFLGPEGAGPSSWLAGRLFGQRVVMLNGQLDQPKAGDAVVQLMTLDAEGDAGIDIYLDAHGHDVGPALAVMDVMDLIGVEITVTCIGRAEGTAVGILAVGHHRRVAPHARIHLDEPRFDIGGHVRDALSWQRHSAEQTEAFARRLARACGQEPERVRSDMERRLWLDAREAVAYGLADQVASQLSLVAGTEDT